ncbi:unnamed protein product [Adineta steineri]|uniref:Uncharacterized protein n=1 Tax=Adineta steineri TaxID=433720 RepID=A0A814ZI42_9BILA|nr:unnamed protein product [Adineta steineri]CAF1243571.1 unnamed protein product [Adineta steineri]CAF1263291.1 unnamed protein product [Adineta steineri]
MARSNQCSTCQKSMGVVYCTGCEGYFCTKDFKGHREILSTEMEELIEERDKLQEKINKATKGNNADNPLIEEINVWEKVTVEKVRQTAEHVRQQANELMNSKCMKTTNKFKDLSDELADLKETENYVEHDLTRLRQKVDQFNVDLTQLFQATKLELNKEENEKIKWNRIIYVQEKSVEVECQQTSTKIKESPQATELLPQRELRCRGRTCAQCGKCTDWYYVKNKERFFICDDATCSLNPPPPPTPLDLPSLTPHPDLLRFGFHICKCK